MFKMPDISAHERADGIGQLLAAAGVILFTIGARILRDRNDQLSDDLHGARAALADAEQLLADATDPVVADDRCDDPACCSSDPVPAE